MATNAPVVDDSKKVTEDDLKNDKLAAEVEEAKVSDETVAKTPIEDSEEAGELLDKPEEPTKEEEIPPFVKEFPGIKGDTEEEYRRNLEIAYRESGTEALRLKNLVDNKPDEEAEEIDLSDPLRLYAKQKMDEDINQAFAEFQKVYPQAVPGSPEYTQFTNEVSTLSQTILRSQQRLASPGELYTKAAVILGWESNAPDSKDKLGMALKDKAATSKTSSGASTSPKSKVTDEMVRTNQLMYPDKTEAQIREELEPYVK